MDATEQVIERASRIRLSPGSHSATEPSSRTTTHLKSKVPGTICSSADQMLPSDHAIAANTFSMCLRQATSAAWSFRAVPLSRICQGRTVGARRRSGRLAEEPYYWQASPGPASGFQSPSAGPAPTIFITSPKLTWCCVETLTAIAFASVAADCNLAIISCHTEALRGPLKSIVIVRPRPSATSSLSSLTLPEVRSANAER